MRTLLLLFMASLLSLTALAQKIQPGMQPYVVINNAFPTDLRYLVLDPTHIESVNVLKDSAATAAYGDKGRQGVVLIRTTPNTTTLRLSAVLDKYGITGADRELKVCIDKVLVPVPELILVDESLLTGVEITTDRVWIHAEDANSTEKFINIKTAQAAKKRQ